MLPFIRKSKYISLSLFCMKEQRRAQNAEYQVQQLLQDNDNLARLYKVYKARADRLQYLVDHPRGHRGRFEKVEFTK